MSASRSKNMVVLASSNRLLSRDYTHMARSASRRLLLVLSAVLIGIFLYLRRLHTQHHGPQEEQSTSKAHDRMPPRPVENVWQYPRPPALQKTAARLQVVWRGADGNSVKIADTTKGYRVLETSHPPTYYFPPSDVNMSLLRPSSARRTMCEWKGQALYHDFAPNGDVAARGRIWSYPTPVPAFKEIKDYLCFYASSNSDAKKTGRWHCYVDDDEVHAQEGDFYGSWITPEITGGDRGFKGGAGTWGW